MSIKTDIDTWSCRIGTEFVVKVFGMPFFLIGSFFLWGGLTTDKINDAPPTIAMRVAFCSFSSIFIIVGLALIASFTKIVINKREKYFRKYRGVLFPLWRATEPLDDYDYIDVSHEVRVSNNSKGGSKRTDVYPVKLAKDSNNKKLIAEPQNLLKSRKFSESLSRFFHLPIEDTSMGPKLKRDPDEVDASIGDMLRKYDVTVEKPERPIKSKDNIQEGYNSEGEKSTLIVFERLGKKDKIPFMVISALSAISGLIVLYYVLTFKIENNGGKFIFDILNHFFSFFFIITLTAFIFFTKKLLQGLTQISLAVTKNKLTIVKNLGLSFKSTIDLNRVEHLFVTTLNEKAQTGKLVLVSDDFYVETASHQNLNELEYVEHLIKYYIQKKY